jgi:hypothetical protein
MFKDSRTDSLAFILLLEKSEEVWKKGGGTISKF